MFIEDDDIAYDISLFQKFVKTTCYTIMTSDDFLRISQMKGEKIRKTIQK